MTTSDLQKATLVALFCVLVGLLAILALQVGSCLLDRGSEVRVVLTPTQELTAGDSWCVDGGIP